MFTNFAKIRNFTGYIRVYSGVCLLINYIKIFFVSFFDRIAIGVCIAKTEVEPFLKQKVDFWGVTDKSLFPGFLIV